MVNATCNIKLQKPNLLTHKHLIIKPIFESKGKELAETAGRPQTEVQQLLARRVVH